MATEAESVQTHRQPKAPGRRRERWKRDEREKALLEAAFEEFATKGYASASLEDVAVRVGVTKGLVLFYFKRKELLFDAVVRQVLVPGLFSPLEATLARDDVHSSELLTDFLRTLYEKQVGNPRVLALLRMFIAEGSKFPVLGEHYFNSVLSRGIETVERLVARGIQRGEFRAETANLQPLVIYGAVMHAIFWRLTLDEYHPLDLNRYLASHVDLVLNGLLVRPKPPASDTPPA